MTRKFAIVISLAALGATALALSATSGGAANPFSPEPAAAHIAALRAVPVFVTPNAIGRLPDDMRPTPGQTHALGKIGYIWTRSSGGVCAFITNGPAGCFSTFTRPVVAFITATSADGKTYTGSFHITGVAADEVAALDLVDTNGTHFSAPVAHNSFSVDVPAGTQIVGESIHLDSGTSFYAAVQLGLPAVPPTPAAGSGP